MRVHWSKPHFVCDDEAGERISDAVTLTDCTFVIDTTLRQRALDSGMTTVHAVLDGTPTVGTLAGEWAPVRYRFPDDSTFLVQRDDTWQPITHAAVVHCTAHEGTPRMAALRGDAMPTKQPVDLFVKQTQCQGCARFSENGAPGSCDILTFFLDVHGPDAIVTNCSKFEKPATEAVDTETTTD